jgi:hypothetical protein
MVFNTEHLVIKIRLFRTGLAENWTSSKGGWICYLDPQTLIRLIKTKKSL